MDYYSSIAEGYDELHGAEQDEKLNMFLDKVKLRANCTVLDIGCGTGRSARILDQFDVHWHGIEPSEGLIKQAPTNIRARIVQAKGEKIPWPEASFDIVLSLTALQNYDDPATGIDEMHRVAKPGALLLISFLKKSSKREELDALLRKKLRITESWEQSKDMMYICTREQQP